MLNELHVSVVKLQYHSKYPNPLQQKFVNIFFLACVIKIACSLSFDNIHLYNCVSRFVKHKFVVVMLGVSLSTDTRCISEF